MSQELLTADEMIQFFHLPSMDGLEGKSNEEIQKVCASYDKASNEVKKVVDAFKVLSYAINQMGSEEKMATILLRCITRDHRTLQQSFWTIMFKVMEKYGKLDKVRYSDLRNEDSIKNCEEVTKVMEEKNLYFRFI
jgi:hypothetical protein